MSTFNLTIMRSAAMLTFITMAGPAWAVLTIETSDAPGIETDAEFPDDHLFDVPAGATIKLIKTPGQNPKGDTHTIKGRYRGTLGEYIRRECWRPGADCSSGSVIPGATKGFLQPGEGGVRGAAPKD